MRVGMPPSVGRLLKRSQFLAVARGRRIHCERMTIQSLPGEDGSAGLRIGFTVTKKVGHATERNRVRRRLRAAAAAATSGRSALPASDLVVIGRASVLHAPFQTIVDDLTRALGVVEAKSAGRTHSPSGSHA